MIEGTKLNAMAAYSIGMEDCPVDHGASLRNIPRMISRSYPHEYVMIGQPSGCIRYEEDYQYNHVTTQG
eukprot:4631248-Amphidinium_carterae.2